MSTPKLPGQICYKLGQLKQRLEGLIHQHNVFTHDLDELLSSLALTLHAVAELEHFNKEATAALKHALEAEPVPKQPRPS